MSSYEQARAFVASVDASEDPQGTIVTLARENRISASHVRNLIRFFRVLPTDVHEAWSSGALTFRALSRLATLAAEGGYVPRDLGRAGRRDLRVSRPGGADARQGVVGAGWAALADRLRSAGPRLDSDDRAPLVLVVLDAAAGRAPMTRVEGVVDELLRDLGVGE